MLWTCNLEISYCQIMKHYLTLIIDLSQFFTSPHITLLGKLSMMLMFIVFFCVLIISCKLLVNFVGHCYAVILKLHSFMGAKA
jgi:hypothetical protein